MRYLFDDTFVTRDEVFAVGANFTVVAWAFACLFFAVQVVWPDSFVSYQGEVEQPFPQPALPCRSRRSPASACPTSSRCSPHARSVAMVEQVAGVLYVAMIISRVVSLTVLHRR